MVTSAIENGSAKPHNGHAVAVTLTKRLVTPDQTCWADPWKGRSGAQLRDVTPFQFRKKALGNTGGFFSLFGELAGADELKFPYVESAIFHACTRCRAEAAATVPWVAKKGKGDKAKPLPDSDPLVQFLSNPSPIMSPADLKDAIEVHLCESGESFVFLANANGDPVRVNEDTGEILEVPRQCVPVSGRLVQEKRDSKGFVTHWGFQAAGSTLPIVFPRAAVIQFKVYTSEDPQRGIGPAQVLARQLSMAFQLERYQEASARNFGPGGYLIYEKELGKDEEDLLQSQVDDAAQDVKSSGTTKVLTGKGWTFIPNPANPKEMQVAEQMLENVRIVCSTMGVPGPMVGRYEDAKFSTTFNARQEFWLSRASAEDRKADTLTAMLVRKLSVQGANYRDCTITADLSNIRSLDVDESAMAKAAAEFSVGNGVPLNKARASFNLEPIDAPGADEAFVKTGLVTLAQALEGPPEPSPSVSTPPPNGDAPAKHGPAPVRRLFDSIRPLSADERKAYSDAYIQRVFAPHEKPLYRQVRAWRSNYARAQIAQLEAFAAGDEKALRIVRDISNGDDLTISEQILLDQKRWAELLDSATRSTLRSAWDFSLADAAAELGVIAMPMSDPRIVEAFSNQMVKLTEGVTSRLAQNVKETILDALRNSESHGTLQERIKADLDAIKTSLTEGSGVFAQNDARALNIARTETGHAASTARFLQWKAEGVEEIQWIDEGDDVVRESHAHGTGVGGEVVKLGARFSNGLLHPHDPNGAASQVINCRCTFIPIIPATQRSAA